MAQFLEVIFHGTTLLVVEHNQQPYVPMKPVVSGMGLAWQSQLAKLTGNVKRWGVTEIVMPTTSGEQGMSCLPLRKLPGWLATISPNKVRPELREKVTAFQNEADDVLWAAWQKQQPARPYNPAIDYDRISPAQAQDLKELVHSIAETKIQGYAETWARLHHKFRVNSYLQLPAAKFGEARDYLLGKLPNGYAGEVMDATQKPITPPQLISYAARSKAAFDAATRAAGEVQRTVFDSVMNGTDDWKHQRLLLAFVTDSATAAPAYVLPIESGSFVATWARLTEDVRNGECLTSTAELLDMASACMQRMQRRSPPAAPLVLLKR